MNEFLTSSPLPFVGGLVVGVVSTVLWLNLFGGIKKRYKENDNNSEYNHVSRTSNGSNKLVLVVRNDLKMGKGKVAAQCSHAAVMAHESARKKYPDILSNWKRNGQPKIVVKIETEDEMLELANKAKKNQLLVNIVSDAGRTQIAAGSKTVLAVGPGPEKIINEVTGHLKLY